MAVIRGGPGLFPPSSRAVGTPGSPNRRMTGSSCRAQNGLGRCCWETSSGQGVWQPSPSSGTNRKVSVCREVCSSRTPSRSAHTATRLAAPGRGRWVFRADLGLSPGPSGLFRPRPVLAGSSAHSPAGPKLLSSREERLAVPRRHLSWPGCRCGPGRRGNRAADKLC